MRYPLTLSAAVLALTLSLSPAMAAPPAMQPTTQSAKVAFVLDASGSMQIAFRGEGDSGRKAVDEVAGAVDQMAAGREFFVVVDTDGATLRYPQKGYAKADKATKAAAARFLADPKVKPGGAAQIDKAVAMACESKPATLWLVSDGSFPDKPAGAGDRIIKAATAAGVKVNTSLVFAAGYWQKEDALFQVSSQTGGVCYGVKGERVSKVEKPAEEPKVKRAPVFIEH